MLEFDVALAIASVGRTTTQSKVYSDYQYRSVHDSIMLITKEPPGNSGGFQVRDGSFYFSNKAAPSPIEMAVALSICHREVGAPHLRPYKRKAVKQRAHDKESAGCVKRRIPLCHATQYNYCRGN